MKLEVADDVVCCAGMRSNFKKYSSARITDYGVPYDYGSIMHYSTHAFSRNGKPTIMPLVSFPLNSCHLQRRMYEAIKLWSKDVLVKFLINYKFINYVWRVDRFVTTNNNVTIAIFLSLFYTLWLRDSVTVFMK